MERFVAELSIVIEEAEFARSWGSNLSLNDKQPKVQFTFDGRRVSALIDSDPWERWLSASFYQSFSAAVRRIDRTCNIRWL